MKLPVLISMKKKTTTEIVQVSICIATLFHPQDKLEVALEINISLS